MHNPTIQEKSFLETWIFFWDKRKFISKGKNCVDKICFISTAYIKMIKKKETMTLRWRKKHGDREKKTIRKIKQRRKSKMKIVMQKKEEIWRGQRKMRYSGDRERRDIKKMNKGIKMLKTEDTKMTKKE